MTEQKQPVSYEWKQVTTFLKYMKELSLTITKGEEPGSEDSLRIMVVKNGVRTFALSLLRRVKQDKEDNQRKYAEYVLEVDIDQPDTVASLSMKIQDYDMSSGLGWLAAPMITTTNSVRENGFERTVELILEDIKSFVMSKVKIDKLARAALKYYIENVLDVFGLEGQFGELRRAVAGYPFFYTELQYKYHFDGIIDEFAERVREKPGTYPESI
jgi:hypothetical protein